MSEELVCLTLQWGRVNQEYINGAEEACIPLKKAHFFIKADDDDPYIAYGYDVTPEISEDLKPFYTHQFDFKKYDYFACSHSGYECVDGKPVRIHGKPVRYEP